MWHKRMRRKLAAAGKHTSVGCCKLTAAGAKRSPCAVAQAVTTEWATHARGGRGEACRRRLHSWHIDVERRQAVVQHGGQAAAGATARPTLPHDAAALWCGNWAGTADGPSPFRCTGHIHHPHSAARAARHTLQPKCEAGHRQHNSLLLSTHRPLLASLRLGPSSRMSHRKFEREWLRRSWGVVCVGILGASAAAEMAAGVMSVVVGLRAGASAHSSRQLEHQTPSPPASSKQRV
jgi:hypothetical protein